MSIGVYWCIQFISKAAYLITHHPNIGVQLRYVTKLGQITGAL